MRQTNLQPVSQSRKSNARRMSSVFGKFAPTTRRKASPGIDESKDIEQFVDFQECWMTEAEFRRMTPQVIGSLGQKLCLIARNPYLRYYKERRRPITRLWGLVLGPAETRVGGESYCWEGGCSMFRKLETVMHDGKSCSIFGFLGACWTSSFATLRAKTRDVPRPRSRIPLSDNNQDGSSSDVDFSVIWRVWLVCEKYLGGDGVEQIRRTEI